MLSNVRLPLKLSTEVAVANEEMHGVPSGLNPLRGRERMEAHRKPPVKVEGRRRLRLSGLTVAGRGTRNLDDWVAYIVTSKSSKLILANRASAQKVQILVSRVQGVLKRQVEKPAKG